MKIKTAFCALFIVPAITGCVHSSSETVKTLPSDLALNANIAAISIKSVPETTSPDFKTVLAAQLRLVLDTCAHGTTPLNLEVSVTDLKKANAGRAILLGDSDGVKGQARLIDPVNGAVVGDYDISRSIGAGGIGGAIVMSNAEQLMAEGFGKEVCDRAFSGQRIKHGK